MYCSWSATLTYSPIKRLQLYAFSTQGRICIVSVQALLSQRQYLTWTNPSPEADIRDSNLCTHKATTSGAVVPMMKWICGIITFECPIEVIQLLCNKTSGNLTLVRVMLTSSLLFTAGEAANN